MKDIVIMSFGGRFLKRLVAGFTITSSVFFGGELRASENPEPGGIQVAFGELKDDGSVNILDREFPGVPVEHCGYHKLIGWFPVLTPNGTATWAFSTGSNREFYTCHSSPSALQQYYIESMVPDIIPISPVLPPPGMPPLPGKDPINRAAAVMSTLGLLETIGKEYEYQRLLKEWEMTNRRDDYETCVNYKINENYKNARRNLLACVEKRDTGNGVAYCCTGREAKWLEIGECRKWFEKKKKEGEALYEYPKMIFSTRRSEKECYKEFGGGYFPGKWCSVKLHREKEMYAGVKNAGYCNTEDGQRLNLTRLAECIPSRYDCPAGTEALRNGDGDKTLSLEQIRFRFGCR